jgi:hypothetical protein
MSTAELARIAVTFVLATALWAAWALTLAWVLPS